jgi:hypothetical protein
MLGKVDLSFLRARSGDLSVQLCEDDVDGVARKYQELVADEVMVLLALTLPYWVGAPCDPHALVHDMLANHALSCQWPRTSGDHVAASGDACHQLKVPSQQSGARSLVGQKCHFLTLQI